MSKKSQIFRMNNARLTNFSRNMIVGGLLALVTIYGGVRIWSSQENIGGISKNSADNLSNGSPLSSRELRSSARERFREIKDDPDGILLLLPDLIESHAFVDRSLYAELLESLGSFSPEQLGQLVALWPDSIPLDLNGNPIPIPSGTELLEEVWMRGFKDSLADELIYESGIEVLDHLAKGRWMREKWLSILLHRGPTLSPEMLQELSKREYSHNEEVAFSAVLRNKIARLPSGDALDYADKLIKVELPPEIASGIVNAVIEIGGTAGLTIEQLANWLLEQPEEQAKYSDTRFMKAALSKGGDDVVQDYLSEMFKSGKDRQRKTDSIVYYARSLSARNPDDALEWSLAEVPEDLFVAKDAAILLALKGIYENDPRKFASLETSNRNSESFDRVYKEYKKSMNGSSK